jgi:predicted MPP superfamily phosphohydrolase
VLLGGDLADGAYGVDAVRRSVAALERIAPVLATPGNHDVRAGLARVRRAVLDGGGRWLPDGEICLPRPVGVALRVSAPLPAADTSSDERENDTPRIVCAHLPAEGLAADRRRDVIAAFAGHLHGGQWAWFRRGARLFPGAWIWPENGLGRRRPGFRLVLSLGVGDTVPFRNGCPRDVILCDVDPDPAPGSGFSAPGPGLTSRSSPAAPAPRSIVPPRPSAPASGSGSSP